METREAIAAAADIGRITAFVEANRATACRRCSTKGVLDKRGLCVPTANELVRRQEPGEEPILSCSEIRAATMKQDPEKEEAARQVKDTIYSLLTGPSGMPQVVGADLNHCTSAVSARANLSATFKQLGKYESHLIAYPNSVSAWESYSRMYERIEQFVKQIKLHEAELKKNWPGLVVGEIRIPAKLERATAPAWLTV